MQDRPDAATLLEQVESELRRGVPLGYSQRVAANAVGLARRELDLKNESDAAEQARLGWLLGRDDILETLNEALCAHIRDGRFTLETAGIAEHLRLTTHEKMTIDQPSYPAFRSLEGQGENR